MHELFSTPTFITMLWMNVYIYKYINIYITYAQQYIQFFGHTEKEREPNKALDIWSPAESVTITNTSNQFPQGLNKTCCRVSRAWLASCAHTLGQGQFPLDKKKTSGKILPDS